MRTVWLLPAPDMPVIIKKWDCISSPLCSLRGRAAAFIIHYLRPILKPPPPAAAKRQNFFGREPTPWCFLRKRRDFFDAKPSAVDFFKIARLFHHEIFAAQLVFFGRRLSAVDFCKIARLFHHGIFAAQLVFFDRRLSSVGFCKKAVLFTARSFQKEVGS